MRYVTIVDIRRLKVNISQSSLLLPAVLWPAICTVSVAMFYRVFVTRGFRLLAATSMRFALFWDVNAAKGGNSLPTFRDNFLLSSSRLKKLPWPLKMEPISCTETPVG